MPRFDDAHRWTDKELESLEWRMKREYQQAAREMRGKQAKWLEKFEREKEQREKALDDTREALEAHERWLQSQAARADWMGDMADQLAQSAHQANVRAMDMVNDHLPRIYAENANMAAFSVDKMLRADTSFTLVNEDAVRYLMGIRTEGADPTQLVRETVWFMPQEGREHIQDVRKREIDAAKDIRWNRQKFTSAITQGILQGESIPNIVKRTREIYGQNMNAAIRAARTATTNAENAGRMNSFERAQRLGIDMEIEWLATLDERTRSTHRDLDGERIQTGEKFSNGLRWPGDPEGPGSEVWNCRCRANGRVVGFDGKRGDWADEVGERWSRLPSGMTYDEWKAAKPVSRFESYENDWGRVSAQWLGNIAAEAVSAPQVNGFAGVVEGQDILGSWQRRPDQFDFEIEDVLDAQGFDGKPRIVDADEFDRAVKQANGGDGLVMQRSYSAPDQATLDAYRDMLYDGKWYVDCSTGGAQYGQGMYAAADYAGILSQGVRDEMEHYVRLGAERTREAAWESVLDSSNLAKLWQERGYADAYGAVAEEELAAFARLSRNGTAFDDLTDAEQALWREAIASGRSSGMLELRSELAREFESDYVGFSYVETMTLDPSARIITYQELQGIKQTGVSSLMIEATGEEPIVQTFFRMTSQLDVNSDDVREARRYVARLAESNPAENERIIGKANELLQQGRENIQSMRSMDDGSLAAALGYDAINATGHGASGSYTVVLNRTKLIIRRPE